MSQHTLTPFPCLTNVPWHSYITRKLAKWINHGPCLALRALNRFSPLQVCPIIAFIHLVEARFTHSWRSCQSTGYILRSDGKECERFVIGSQRLIQTTISLTTLPCVDVWLLLGQDLGKSDACWFAGLPRLSCNEQSLVILFYLPSKPPG